MHSDSVTFPTVMVFKSASQSSTEGMQHPSSVLEGSDGRVVPKSVEPIEAVMSLCCQPPISTAVFPARLKVSSVVLNKAAKMPSHSVTEPQQAFRAFL